MAEGLGDGESCPGQARLFPWLTWALDLVVSALDLGNVIPIAHAVKVRGFKLAQGLGVASEIGGKMSFSGVCRTGMVG